MRFEIRDRFLRKFKEGRSGQRRSKDRRIVALKAGDRVKWWGRGRASREIGIEGLAGGRPDKDMDLLDEEDEQILIGGRIRVRKRQYGALFPNRGLRLYRMEAFMLGKRMVLYT